MRRMRAVGRALFVALAWAGLATRTPIDCAWSETGPDPWRPAEPADERPR